MRSRPIRTGGRSRIGRGDGPTLPDREHCCNRRRTRHLYARGDGHAPRNRCLCSQNAVRRDTQPLTSHPLRMETTPLREVVGDTEIQYLIHEGRDLAGHLADSIRARGFRSCDRRSQAEGNAIVEPCWTIPGMPDWMIPMSEALCGRSNRCWAGCIMITRSQTTPSVA